MYLDKNQAKILNGSEGETMAKIMKTLVMYGETFDADKLIPITSEEGHLVTSFGINVMDPYYEMFESLLDAGIVSKQNFTVDPSPVDMGNVPASPIQKLVFKILYKNQKRYDDQLKRMGLKGEDMYTCTCYMDEVGNIPDYGDILSWAESSAVVYANSVLGARCNRNSAIIEMFGSIIGYVPNFGLTTNDGRKATWVIEVKTNKLPEAQVLGSAIGLKVMESVPYVKGLDNFLGNELTQEVKDYLKDMGAATASNGAVGLYHVEGITPEAKKLKEDLIKEEAKEYVIDDSELLRVQNSYPCIWKNPNSKPKLAFIGCPHLSLLQLKDWAKKIDDKLRSNDKKKVSVPTVLTSSVPVINEFKKTEEYQILISTGVKLSYICPLMYLSNPLCSKMPIITNSNKLRTYTTAKYYKDDEILNILGKELG
ncbi:MAG TPA: aconitase X [Anaerovoracaceae bacterium]|nr:aconitase X [Anaerovoracaceae bacterium]